MFSHAVKVTGKVLSVALFVNVVSLDLACAGAQNAGAKNAGAKHANAGRDNASAVPESQDFLALSLEELMETNVEVASRVSLRLGQQPVSVTTINAEQIHLSGARTLNELLMLHVPGYFLVEDQDDTIAAVRGMAPDNNSKLMLLLDGRNLNADWFWGPPDAVLNGIDLSWIERIEVIRGPGSVTQGQGALLGVVNIVSRRTTQQSQQTAQLDLGADGRRGGSWRWNWVGNARESGAPRHFELMLSNGHYEGNRIANVGLATQVEQGLSVFERNHHLKRSDYQNALLRYSDGNLDVSAFHFDQLRDLYNWRRDREQVRQRIDGIELQLKTPLSQGELNTEVYFHQDDYELRSHGGSLATASRVIVPGLILGGSREDRFGARVAFSSGDWFELHRFVIGAEANRYRFGQTNFRGNNFIVNTQEAALASGYALLNERNRWAFPGALNVKSIFAEDFIRLSDAVEAFVAARWDSHPEWGSQLSPRVGVLWQANTQHDFRLSWQRGFRGAVGVNYSGGFAGDGLLREANFAEVENNEFFRANGNTNLKPVKPEQLSSLELAWRYQANERFRLNAVAFYNVTENVIGVGANYLADDALRARALAEHTRIGSDVIGDWGGVFYFQNNAGKLRHLGLEFELEYQLPEYGLNCKLSQASVRVQDVDAGQFGPGNIYVSGTVDDPHVRSFPENVSRAALRWQPGFASSWIVQLTQIYYPSWHPPNANNVSNALTAPGNSITNLGVAWQIKQINGLLAELQFKNLFGADNLYPATSVAGEGQGNQGVPALEERSAWLSLQYRF